METPRYLFEKEYGKEWFTRIGEFHGFAGLIKILATVARSRKRAACSKPVSTSCPGPEKDEAD